MLELTRYTALVTGQGVANLTSSNTIIGGALGMVVKGGAAFIAFKAGVWIGSTATAFGEELANDNADCNCN